MDAPGAIESTLFGRRSHVPHALLGRGLTVVVITLAARRELSKATRSFAAAEERIQ